MRRSLKMITCGLIALAGAIALPNYDAAASRLDLTGAIVDPMSLYGEEIYFDVYRKGDKVGYHRVRFSGSASDLTVQSDFQLRIDVLFITVFRYLYQSEGRWRQGQLERLTASVDDDGKVVAVDVVPSGGRLKVESADKAFMTDSPLFPTSHWNAEVLGQTRVLNTLTGQINDVRIEPRGRETITTERGTVTATRYAYTGALQTEVWYDDAGRWVKMRFNGPDGAEIEYVCRRCQGAGAAKAEKRDG